MSSLLTTFLNASVLLVFALSVFIERGLMHEMPQVTHMPQMATQMQSPEVILNAPNPEFFRPERSAKSKIVQPNIIGPELNTGSAAEWGVVLRGLSEELFAWMVTSVLQSGHSLQLALTPKAFKPTEAHAVGEFSDGGQISHGSRLAPHYAQEPVAELRM